MSVVDVQAFGVVVVAADDRGAVVRFSLGDGVGKLAAGRSRSVEDVD
jgi:hypothetical protein